MRMITITIECILPPKYYHSHTPIMHIDAFHLELRHEIYC